MLLGGMEVPGPGVGSVVRTAARAPGHESFRSTGGVNIDVCRGVVIGHPSLVEKRQIRRGR